MSTHPRIVPLVGLIGKKGAGKDTFARTLTDEFGFTRLAFADPMKDALLATDPYVGSRWDFMWHGTDVDDLPDLVRLSDLVEDQGMDYAKRYAEVRRLLQRYGMGVRQIDPTFWVRQTMDRSRQTPGPVVITDVRFHNEAVAVRQHGGVLVRIYRPSQSDFDDHVSETELDTYAADYSVMNDGSPGDLATAARKIGALAWK